MAAATFTPVTSGAPLIPEDSTRSSQEPAYGPRGVWLRWISTTCANPVNAAKSVTPSASKVSRAPPGQLEVGAPEGLWRREAPAPVVQQDDGVQSRQREAPENDVPVRVSIDVDQRDALPLHGVDGRRPDPPVPSASRTASPELNVARFVLVDSFGHLRERSTTAERRPEPPRA